MRRERIEGKNRYSVWLRSPTEAIELKRTTVKVYGVP
jgi:hypothetical protein